MVRHADHIACVGRLGDAAILREEHQRIVDAELFPARRLQTHAAPELARAKPQEGHAVAVVRVHVRLNLEDEAGDRIVSGMDRDRLALALGLLVARRRGIQLQGAEQFGHAEMAQRRTVHDRRHVAGEEGLLVELRQQAGGHFQAFGQLGIDVAVQIGFQRCVIRCDAWGIADLRRLAGTALELDEFLLRQVHHAGKALAAGGGPVERRGIQLQPVLNLVQQVDRLQRLAVHLVDEGHDGDVTQAADFKQFERLRLDAFRRVQNHDGAVGGGQGAVGVFGEVFVARRVEQVEDEVLKLERHDRGRNRDAPVTFDLHPVGPCAPGFAARSHFPGCPNGAASQKQVLRQRGLAGVRV